MFYCALPSVDTSYPFLAFFTFFTKKCDLVTNSVIVLSSHVIVYKRKKKYLNSKKSQKRFLPNYLEVEKTNFYQLDRSNFKLQIPLGNCNDVIGSTTKELDKAS